jgi:hybrid cluster-associated redox disulfide protein
MAKKAFVFRSDTNIQKAMDLSPQVLEAFRRLGLKCFDCPAAEIEDLRLAALYHEKNLDEILRELNRLEIEEPPPKTDAPKP